MGQGIDKNARKRRDTNSKKEERGGESGRRELQD